MPASLYSAATGSSDLLQTLRGRLPGRDLKKKKTNPSMAPVAPSCKCPATKFCPPQTYGSTSQTLRRSTCGPPQIAAFHTVTNKAAWKRPSKILMPCSSYHDCGQGTDGAAANDVESCWAERLKRQHMNDKTTSPLSKLAIVVP
jgi:hypothetical protein